jgi:hypothetical protein
LAQKTSESNPEMEEDSKRQIEEIIGQIKCPKLSPMILFWAPDVGIVPLAPTVGD